MLLLLLLLLCKSDEIDFVIEFHHFFVPSSFLDDIFHTHQQIFLSRLFPGLRLPVVVVEAVVVVVVVLLLLLWW